MVEQSSLAHPGFAVDHDDAARPRSCTLDELIERQALGAPILQAWSGVHRRSHGSFALVPQLAKPAIAYPSRHRDPVRAHATRDALS
jgi:hypothetical protein